MDQLLFSGYRSPLYDSIEELRGLALALLFPNQIGLYEFLLEPLLLNVEEQLSQKVNYVVSVSVLNDNC